MRTAFYPTDFRQLDETKEKSDSFGQRYAATIGFFDGVHQGHNYVIRQLCQLAAQRSLQPMVITFERHPRQVLQSDWQPQLLTTLEEKTQLLGLTGIEWLTILQFDRSMSQLSSQQFMSQVLKRDLHVDLLLTGYDNRFGHDRTSTFSDYVDYGRQLGIEVVAGQPLDVDSLRVSSSLIRRLLTEGRVREATACLGRPYSLRGKVVHGQQIGRRLGFPTANIVPTDSDRLVPAPGVYAVRIMMDANHSTCYQGMMNIGTRPTFDGHRQTLEANIFDFIGDLYGCELTVSFIERLRDERPFQSAEALAEQMRQDGDRAREILQVVN